MKDQTYTIEEVSNLVNQIQTLTDQRDAAMHELRHLADLLDGHFDRGGTVAGIGTTNKARNILSQTETP